MGSRGNRCPTGNAMIHQSTRRRVWEKLLESLGSAETGDRELDIVIHYLLGAQAMEAGGEAGQMIELLVEEGYPWEVVSELLDAELPPYTATLDAALPGENIVLALYSPRRGRWAAVHETRAGEQVLVWAVSECLARRRAALKALRATLLPQPALAPAKPAKRPAPSAVSRPPIQTPSGAAAPKRPTASPHGWSLTPDPEATPEDVEPEVAEQEDVEPEVAAEEEGEAEWKILF